MEMHEGDAGLSKSCVDPKSYCPIELQPSKFHEFGDFPARDNADAEDAVSTEVEKFAVPPLQAIRLRHPPNPDVGIQQNHCRASQSSLATGSNGSRYSRTESRRLQSAAFLDAVLFEIT